MTGAKAVGYMKPDIDPNTRLYIPFNEGIGSVAKDYSQYCNHAALTDVLWGIGIGGSAGIFNGISAYGVCSIEVSVSGTGTWIFETQINPKDIVSIGNVFQNSLANNDRTGMTVADNMLRFGTFNGVSHTGKSGDIPANRWIRIVGSSLVGTINLYINAILQVGTLDPQIYREYTKLWLGCLNELGTPNLFFNGAISPVIIKSLIKSAAQIAADNYEVCT